jgi:hypothetical protein
LYSSITPWVSLLAVNSDLAVDLSLASGSSSGGVPDIFGDLVEI